jgi:hypothetical protein
VRSVVLALALLALAAPARAVASPALTLDVAKPELVFGQRHALSGVLADGATPIPNQVVVLDGIRAPQVHGFRQLARTVTDAQGNFHFTLKLDRNYRLRATVPALGAVSPVVRAFTLPAFKLTFRGLRPGVVRLIQSYTVPRAVRLTAPTLFYLGRVKARRSSVRVQAPTRRLRAGHFRSRATVKLPAAWKGRFRFGSCFRTTAKAVMGRPGERCPKRFSFG